MFLIAYKMLPKNVVCKTYFFNSNVIELRNKKHTHIEGHIHMMMGHGSSFTEQLFHFLFEASLMLLMGQNHIGTIPVDCGAAAVYILPSSERLSLGSCSRLQRCLGRP